MPGCFLCSNIYSRHPEILPFRYEFEKLMLSSSDIGAFHRIYSRFKFKTNSSVRGVMCYFNIPTSSICKEVFCVDGLEDCVLDFRSFVLCVWNLCTQSENSLVSYLFDLLTKPCNSIEAVCKDIFGDPYSQDEEIKEICNSVISKSSGMTINSTTFHYLCESFPTLLEPLLEMQLKLRKGTLGSKKWWILTSQRQTMNNSVYVWKKAGSLVLHFAPKLTKSMTMVDSGRGEYIALESQKTEPAGSSPRVHNPSMTSEADEMSQVVPSNVDAALAAFDNSHSGSSVCSQTGIKLRSKDSMSSVAASDVSSLTNFTLGTTGTDNVNVPPSSPRASLVQISRIAQSPVTKTGCVASPSNIAKATLSEASTPRVRVKSNGNSSESKTSGSAESANHETPLKKASKNGTRAVMSKTKVVPTDYDSVASADADTIDEALGWRKGQRR